MSIENASGKSRIAEPGVRRECGVLLRALLDPIRRQRRRAAPRLHAIQTVAGQSTGADAPADDGRGRMGADEGAKAQTHADDPSRHHGTEFIPLAWWSTGPRCTCALTLPNVLSIIRDQWRRVSALCTATDNTQELITKYAFANSARQAEIAGNHRNRERGRHSGLTNHTRDHR